MKPFLLKVILGIISVLGFIYTYGKFCDYFFTERQFLDHVSNKRAWCQKKTNEHFNWAVIGSSRAFGSFDMVLLEQLSNKKLINLGANGSGYLDNYLILYQFLKNNNTLDTLFIQTDIYSLNAKQSFSNAFHIFNFLPYIKDPIINDELLSQITPLEQLTWSTMPAIRYFQYNKYFSPKEIIRRYSLRKKIKSPFDASLGGSTKNQGSDFIAHGNRQSLQSLDANDLSYLLKIIALCRQYDIAVIAYTAPEFINHKQEIAQQAGLTQKISQILTEQQVSLIVPEEKIEKDQLNFSDPLHLSKTGRITFTQSFYTSLIR